MISAAEKDCADEVARWATEDQHGWHVSMMTDHGEPGIYACPKGAARWHPFPAFGDAPKNPLG